MSALAIKAIPTPYGGAMFRSRLEARYAVFFDAMGVMWGYEHEGYQTSAGYYLADFYLPAIDAWIEIKPEHPTAGEIEKCRALAEGVPGAVRLLYGPFGWWLDRLPERRAGGIAFWRELDGDVWIAQTDESYRYQPASCADCGALGFTFAGSSRDVCGRGDDPGSLAHLIGTPRDWSHKLDVDSPLALPAVSVATRIALAHRFDGGR